MHPVHQRAGVHEPRRRRRNLHAGVTGIGPRRRGERGLHDQIAEAKKRLGTAAGAKERVRRIRIDGIETTVPGGRFQAFEDGPAEILARPGHDVGLLPRVVADVPDRELAGVAVRRIVAPRPRAQRHPERIAQPQRPHPRPRRPADWRRRNTDCWGRRCPSADPGGGPCPRANRSSASGTRRHFLSARECRRSGPARSRTRDRCRHH